MIVSSSRRVLTAVARRRLPPSIGRPPVHSILMRATKATAAGARRLNTQSVGVAAEGAADTMVAEDGEEQPPALSHAPDALPGNHPPPLALRMKYQLYFSVAKALRLQKAMLRGSIDNPAYYELGIADYREYGLDERDVVVATHPKCGTNLLMHAMFQISWLGQGNFKHINNVVAEVGSYPDRLPAHVRLRDLRNADVVRPSPTGLRVVKSHWALQDLERIYEDGFFGMKLEEQHRGRPSPQLPNSKFVTSFRDPKEAFVSAYHNFAASCGWPSNAPGFTMHDYLDIVFTDGHPPRFFTARDFVRHNVGVWEAARRADTDNVFFVRYRDMVGDRKETVAKLAEFVGVALTPAQIDAVAHKCSFAHMKSIGEKFRQPKSGVFMSGATLVRSGKTGNSKELLSDAQANYIDERMQELFHEANPSFPYSKIYLEYRVLHYSVG